MVKKVEDRYVKLTHKEHILKRSETYIGSIQMDTKNIFVATDYDNIKEVKMEYKTVTYNPGFIKIFDEIITNASDHAIRTGQVSYIKINIDEEIISVENDGPGIPVEIHGKEKIYIPEMVFGHLLTGENYSDDEERFVGGRNGYGAKLTNIYSTMFEVETADGKKVYRQKFSKNMSSMTKPVTRKSKKSFTKITYKPDFEKFDMITIDEQTKSLLVKRVIDIAAYNPTVKVFLNGVMIPVRSFRDYMKLFIEPNGEIFYEKINDFWEIGVAKSPSDLFTHVSMVNGISTIFGGTHVNFVTSNVVNAVKDLLTKTNKGINIRPNDIKNRFLIFINSKIVNPVFDNQTKENLTSKLNGQLKDVQLNDAIIKRISKSDMLDDLIKLSMMKDQIQLQKELNKDVFKKVKVDKLVDANKAGTVESEKCHLFLTEGDCLYEETLITILRDSEKLKIKIKDVKLDDVVITHKSNFKLITNITKKIEKSVTINLKNGEILICSENHKWFIYDKIKNDFLFVRTKDIDIKIHKMIINKNINFNGLVKINDIKNIKDDKFNKIIYIDGDEILSTNNHKFSVFNINDNSIIMLECDKIDKNIHFLVDYDKI